MFQHGATCFDSAATVNQLIGAGNAGGVVRLGDKVYLTSVASFTDTSITYDFTPTDGSAHILQTLQTTPPPCGLLTGADALQIGWMIALVWLTVYAITFISGYIKNETFGASNDT